jgi:hypothetical protein
MRQQREEEEKKEYRKADKKEKDKEINTERPEIIYNRSLSTMGENEVRVNTSLSK